MGKLDEVKQNIKGTMDEAKGEMNIQSGNEVKGGMQKLRGKFEKATAPLHNATDDEDN